MNGEPLLDRHGSPVRVDVLCVLRACLVAIAASCHRFERSSPHAFISSVTVKCYRQLRPALDAETS